mgnify:CR=1 FL=1
MKDLKTLLNAWLKCQSSNLLTREWEVKIESFIEKYAKDHTIKELKKLRTTVEAKNYGTDMWHLINDKIEKLK